MGTDSQHVSTAWLMAEARMDSSFAEISTVRSEHRDSILHEGVEQNWLSLDFPSGVPAAQWICLRYRTSLYDDAVRPRLLVRTSSATREIPIPAGLFGRGEWVGYLPQDTREIAISPTIHGNPTWRRLHILSILARAFERNFPFTLLAAMHLATGRLSAARGMLSLAGNSTALTRYHQWRARSSREIDSSGADAPRAEWAQGPHIRVVIDRTGSSAEALERTLTSIDLQLYPDRSATVIESGAADTILPSVLDGLSQDDFIAPMRSGDILTPYALAAVAQYAIRHPEAELLYADEDAVEACGRHVDPLLKPDWSPAFQAKRPYLGRAVYLRLSAIAALPHRQQDKDPFSAEFWSAYFGIGKPTGHIRRVLLTKALPNAGAEEARHRPPAPALFSGSDSTTVTIIIPNKDKPDLLTACLRSLEITRPLDYEILIVDNGSERPDTKALYHSATNDPRIRVLSSPGPFNFSDLCNRAAAVAKGEVLVFLNNDTLVLRADWMTQLVGWATRAEYGAVGAKLIYPSGRLQHGGIVIGLGGYAAHIDSGAAADDAGYLDRSNVTHEVSAVTGACLAVERAKFEAVGGFDADGFPVELGDVDLCLRLENKGWRTIFVADAVLVHRESATRGRARDREVRYSREHANFMDRWKSRMLDDPYFHPALALTSSRTRLDG